MDLAKFNPEPPKRCPLGVDVVPKAHAGQIEPIVMIIVLSTIFPLLLASLLVPSTMELYDNAIPGLDVAGYLSAAVLAAMFFYTSLSMGKPFIPLSKKIREFHETMADTRKAPASIVASYQLVKELPEVLERTPISSDSLSDVLMLGERAEELVTEVSRLLEASLDEVWVLKQAPSLELLELGKQARKIMDKAQDLRFAHLTAEVPLALGSSSRVEPILDYSKTPVSELDEYISAVNQALS